MSPLSCPVRTRRPSPLAESCRTEIQHRNRWAPASRPRAIQSPATCRRAAAWHFQPIPGGCVARQGQIRNDVCQPAGAAEGLRIALRHRPVAHVFPVIVRTQAIGLILATGSLVAPQAILIPLDGGHEVPVGQVRKRMAAIQATDVFEENETLTMRAMKGFHGAPRASAHLEAQLADSRKTRACERPGLCTGNCSDGKPFLCQQMGGIAMNTLTQQHTGISATPESQVSAVSWPAIFGGAFVAAAVSLVLVALGSGLGLASVSPWRDAGATATTVAWMTAAWLIVVQWLASGLGGYVAGRLRTKWANIHTHEVFFRDTAHGFITWAVGTILVAGLLTSAVTSAIGGGVHAAATVASGAAQGAATQASGPSQAGSALATYDMDLLFRSSQTSNGITTTDARAEAARILANGLTSGDVPTTDRAFLADLVAARTGISTEDAQMRVDTAIARAKAADVKARQAADAARKAASEASIFTALSMLVGAFIACIAAAPRRSATGPACMSVSRARRFVGYPIVTLTGQ